MSKSNADKDKLSRLRCHCFFIPIRLPRCQSLKLVGLDRFELSASSLSGTRSNQLSYKPIMHGWLKYGGDDRDRTDDLRLAKAALSQLSYVPRKEVSHSLQSAIRPHSAKVPRTISAGHSWG